MLHKIRRQLADSYRKNKDDVAAILLGRYPRFVYRRLSKLPLGEIPVFAFHTVESRRFEAQLEYLAENGYKTLAISVRFSARRCTELVQLYVSNRYNETLNCCRIQSAIRHAREVLQQSQGSAECWMRILDEFGLDSVALVQH